MSAQGGVFYRQGQPPAAGLLDRIGRSLERQGPDGGCQRQSGAVGMAYRACHITPESMHESQPMEGRSGTLLTWDGRLDNRGDLLFQLRDSLGEDRTDAAIALAAFERWGRDSFSRLIGDWAMSAWETRSRTLCLARDYAGACPLYYSALVPGLLLWSSELEELAALAVALSGKALQLDEPWIAGYLAFHPAVTLTPFVGIHPVPPGCFVAASADSLATERHWTPDPELRIRYRTDAEYEEHFRDLLRQAVRCRLRSEGPVWAHLSGGLDSSAIVCVADDILGRDGAETPAVETITSVYDQSPESDERRFVAPVEEQRGRPGHHFSEIDYPLLSQPFYQHPVGAPAFIDCFAQREQAICAAMGASGARVQLCGQGGDELLGNIGGGVPSLLDSIHFRRWNTVWKDLGRWGIALKQARLQLALEVLLSSLPARLQISLDCTQATGKRLQFIHPEFSTRLDFCTRAVPIVNDPYGLALPSARGGASGLQSVIDTVSLTLFRRMGATHVTYPFLHRPLVAFLLSIPVDQLMRPGERRSLMRRSLRTVLPAPVLRRRAKQSPDSALYRALNREWSTISPLLETPLSAALGYISATELIQAAGEARHGAFPVTLVAKALCLEVWLRSQRPMLEALRNLDGFSTADPERTKARLMYTGSGAVSPISRAGFPSGDSQRKEGTHAIRGT